jgi:hypothetical protein
MTFPARRPDAPDSCRFAPATAPGGAGPRRGRSGCGGNARCVAENGSGPFEDSRPKGRSNKGSASGAEFHTHRSPATGASIKISFWRRVASASSLRWQGTGHCGSVRSPNSGSRTATAATQNTTVGTGLTESGATIRGSYEGNGTIAARVAIGSRGGVTADASVGVAFDRRRAVQGPGRDGILPARKGIEHARGKGRYRSWPRVIDEPDAHIRPERPSTLPVRQDADETGPRGNRYRRSLAIRHADRPQM